MGSANSTIFVGEETDVSYLIATCVFPSFPSLVETNITPFAPLAPYKAVAVASFMIEKLAMSST
ncbi:hypothetical protein DSECCO2_635670 [anaerobic digester metagenome]